MEVSHGLRGPMSNRQILSTDDSPIQAFDEDDVQDASSSAAGVNFDEVIKGPGEIYYPVGSVPKENTPVHINFVPETPEGHYVKSNDRDILRNKSHPLYPKVWRGSHLVYDRTKDNIWKCITATVDGGISFFPNHEVQKDYPPSLSFESRFECGNLRHARRIGQYEYDLTLQTDLYVGRHTQWYYFKIGNMLAGITYRFNIINFLKKDSLYNYGMKPLMYSTCMAEDRNIGWIRIGHGISYIRNFKANSGTSRKHVFYTLSFQLEFPVTNDICYLAHCYPYTYTDLMNHLQEYSLACPEVFESKVLCKTLAGNDCPLITITDKEEKSTKKRAVVLSARVHPGETNSSWIMKGILDFLTGGSDIAKELQRHLKFVIIPMLNPDGVVVGNYRCSLAGKDLNRAYVKPRKELYPTVWHAKDVIEQLQEEYEVILYCDIHGHSRMSNIFMYGCHEGLYTDAKELLHQRLLPWIISKQAKETFAFRNCNFSISKSKETTARVVVWREFGITNSFTLEASFCGTRQGDHGRHFTVQDLLDMGKHFCTSLMDLCHIYDSVNGTGKTTDRYYSVLCKMSCGVLRHFQKLEEEDSDTSESSESDLEVGYQASEGQRGRKDCNTSPLEAMQHRKMHETSVCFSDARKSSATQVQDYTNAKGSEPATPATSNNSVKASKIVKEIKQSREESFQRRDALVRQLLRNNTRRNLSNRSYSSSQDDEGDRSHKNVNGNNINNVNGNNRKLIELKDTSGLFQNCVEIGLTTVDKTSLDSYICTTDSDDDVFSKNDVNETSTGQYDTPKDGLVCQNSLEDLSDSDSSGSHSKSHTIPLSTKNLVIEKYNKRKEGTNNTTFEGPKRTTSFSKQLILAKSQQRYRSLNANDDEKLKARQNGLPLLDSRGEIKLTASSLSKTSPLSCAPDLHTNRDSSVLSKTGVLNSPCSESNPVHVSDIDDNPANRLNYKPPSGPPATFFRPQGVAYRNRDNTHPSKHKQNKQPAKELFERALGVLNRLELRRIDEKPVSSDSDSDVDKQTSGKRSYKGRRKKLRKTVRRRKVKSDVKRPNTVDNPFGIIEEEKEQVRRLAEKQLISSNRAHSSKTIREFNAEKWVVNKNAIDTYQPKVIIKRNTGQTRERSVSTRRTISVSSKEGIEDESNDSGSKDHYLETRKARANSVPSVFSTPLPPGLKHDQSPKSNSPVHTKNPKKLENIGKMKSFPFLPKLDIQGSSPQMVSRVKKHDRMKEKSFK